MLEKTCAEALFKSWTIAVRQHTRMQQHRILNLDYALLSPCTLPTIMESYRLHSEICDAVQVGKDNPLFLSITPLVPHILTLAEPNGLS
jgi:hypothetical protein